MKKTALMAALAIATLGVGLAAHAQQAAQPAPRQGAQAAGQGGGGRGNGDPRRGQPSPTPNLQPLAVPTLPYAFGKNLTEANGQRLANVGSIALTPSGNLIVFNRNPVIQMVEFDPTGKAVRAFNPNIAVNAHGLRIDRHGNIWAVDSFLNVVWKLNAKGEPLAMYGKRGEVGPWTDDKWNGMFNQPLDVAIDDDDNFYVVQGHAGTSEPPSCTYCATYSNPNRAAMPGSDARVIKFDKTGKYLGTLALPHGPTERYPFIHTIVVTKKGELWIGDRQENKIIVASRDLKKLREIQQPVLTSGLFVDAKGDVWQSAGMDGMIVKLDENGKIVGQLGKAGRTQDPNSTDIGEAHYMVVTPDQKTIYIADSVNAKVLVAKAK
jgi:DNA-binding beta-propeller fold protein YncE